MFPSLFGLSRRPFSSTPDPECLVRVGGMPEAISELERCAQDGQGIGILTAPAGLGKTVLCRKLVELLRDQFAVVFLPNANFPTRRSLLQAILYEMGHPYLRLGEQELRLEFASAVRDLPPDRDGLVVIVDEADLLHHRLLEELRTATHLVQDGEMLVRLILSGQLELEERLIKKDLAAINQRIVCHVTLASLTMAESEAYLKERIEWAGGVLPQIYEPDAVRMICQASDGNPRCLNQLADQSLLLASSANATRVNTGHVLAALDELKQLPLHWNHVESPKPASGNSAQVQSHFPKSPAETGADEGQTAVIEFGAPEEDLEAPASADATESIRDEQVDEHLGDTEILDGFEPAEELDSQDATEIELAWDEEPCDEGLDATEVLSVEDLAGMGVETDVFQETADQGFAEELVYDHATAREKGFPLELIQYETIEIESEDPLEALRAEEDAFPIPPASSACPDLTLVNPLPLTGEEWQPEDLALPEQAPANADPSGAIDQVMPLIETALADRLEDSAPMVLADSCLETLLAEVSAYCNGETDGEAPDAELLIDRETAWGLPIIEHPEQSQEYYLSSPGGISPGDLEEHIAQLVLDAYSDLKPLIWDSTQSESAEEPPPAAQGEEPIRDPGDRAPFEELQKSLRQAVESLESAIEPEAEISQTAMEYDIVMPDDDEEADETPPRSRADAAECEGIDPCQSPRPYKNLFSKIRRQERA